MALPHLDREAHERRFAAAVDRLRQIVAGSPDVSFSDIYDGIYDQTLIDDLLLVIAAAVLYTEEYPAPHLGEGR